MSERTNEKEVFNKCIEPNLSRIIQLISLQINISAEPKVFELVPVKASASNFHLFLTEQLKGGIQARKCSQE